MTVSGRAKEALEPFGLPVTDGFFPEKEKEYLILKIPTESGANFGDDRPLFTVAEIEVHWFLPMDVNYHDKKNQIREALFQAGFTYPDVTVITDPKQIRHIIFECEYAE